MREESYIKPEFINDNDISNDTFLWRYMDLNKFLSFIINKSLYLTRLDKFEDKREGINIHHLLFLHRKNKMNDHPFFAKFSNYLTIDNFPAQTNNFENEIKSVQRFTFANCWVLGNQNKESVAMWNLYSKPNSIAIKVKYSNFKDFFSKEKLINHGHLKQIICSPVEYGDFQDEFWVNNQFKSQRSIFPVFMKDISFSHEKEFRIVLHEIEREIPPLKYKENITNRRIEEIYNTTYNYPGKSIELNEFDKYEFEVVFHPKTDKWAKDSIKSMIEKLGIHFKVSDSKLELK